jgi:hypothetical protein
MVWRQSRPRVVAASLSLAPSAALWAAVCFVASPLAAQQGQVPAVQPSAAPRPAMPDIPRMKPSADVLSVARRMLRAGVGDAAAAQLPEPSQALALGGEPLTPEAVQAKLNAIGAGATLGARREPVVEGASAAVVARAERLLRAGNAQAAFRLLDELSVRAPDAGVEWLLAEAAMRAGREDAAFDACLRAVRQGTLAQGKARHDEATMLWLASEAAGASQAERGAMLAKAWTLKDECPAWLAIVLEERVARFLGSIDEQSRERALLLESAAARLGQLAMGEAENAGENESADAQRGQGDAWARDLWCAGPATRAVAKVRAASGREAARATDLALARGDAAEALRLAIVDAGAAEAGSAAAWDAGVRVIAAHMALGDVQSACVVLGRLVSEQRTSRLEQTWVLAREVVLLARERNGATEQAEQAITEQAITDQAITDQALAGQVASTIDRAYWQRFRERGERSGGLENAIRGMHLRLAMLVVSEGSLSQAQPQQPSLAQRIMFAGSGIDGPLASHAGAPSEAQAVLVAEPIARALGRALRELPDSIGSLDDVALAIARICKGNKSTLLLAAQEFVRGAGEERAATWAATATQDESRIFAACVLWACKRYEQADQLIAARAVREVLWLRVLLLADSGKHLEAAKLLASQRQMLQPETLVWLAHQGVLPRVQEQPLLQSDLGRAEQGRLLAASTQQPQTAETIAVRAAAVESLRTLSSMQGLGVAEDRRVVTAVSDVLLVASGHADDPTTQQARALLRRVVPMVDRWNSVVTRTDLEIDTLLDEAVRSVEKRAWAEVEGRSQRLALALLDARSLGVVIDPSVEKPFLSASRTAALERVARACDPRLVAQWPLPQRALALTLVQTARQLDEANLCAKRVVLQLEALAGERPVQALLAESAIEVKRQRGPSTNVLDVPTVIAIDEGLAMRGAVEERTELMLQAALRTDIDARVLAGPAVMRLGSWGSTDGALRFVRQFLTQGGASKPVPLQLAIFVEALSLDDPPADGSTGAYAAELLYVVANIAHNDLRDEMAATLYREVLAIAPTHAWAANNLAYLLLERGGDLAEAERLLELAIAENAESSSITDSVGWLRYKQGKIEDFERDGERRGGAIAWLERAHRLGLREGRTSAEVSMHLGDAYWRRAELMEQQAQPVVDAARGPAHWKQLAQAMWQVAEEEAQLRLRAYRAIEAEQQGGFVGNAITYAEHVRQLGARLAFAKDAEAGKAWDASPLAPMSLDPVTRFRPAPERQDMRPRTFAPDGDVCSRFEGGGEVLDAVEQ